jgi:fructokinase
VSSDGRGFDTSGRPLVVGEVLFDVMPDGDRVLGGAPFNVAWHLEAFGLRPLMITRVGADDEGDEVVAAMESWGMDTSGVQRDRSHPTGKVKVELDDGEPTFHILADQAYDRLDGESAAGLIEEEDPSLLYHGSLLARGETSASALDRVKETAAVPVFIDVNLRDPWWNHVDVLASVSRARWIKVNEAELGLLGGAPDPATAEAFRSDHGLDTVIVTRGGMGAEIVNRDGRIEAAAPADIEVVDTVGAGDAFSAVFILGLATGWSAKVTLARSLEFAAAMCTVPGATVRDRDFYSRFSGQGWW